MTISDDNWMNRDAKSFKSRNRGTIRHTNRKNFAREELLKQWYGKQLGVNEIAAHRFNEKTLGELIPNLVKDLGIEEEGVYAIIFSNWPDLVGKELQRRLFPVAVKKDCLHVETSDSATLYHMQQSFLKKTLLEKVTALTEGKITKIRFVPCGRA